MKKPPQDPSLQGAGKYYAARRQRAATQKAPQPGQLPSAAAPPAPGGEVDERRAPDAKAPARK